MSGKSRFSERRASSEQRTRRSKSHTGNLLSCSFCGKSQKQVKKLIAGPGVYICDACIDLRNEITQERHAEPAGAEQNPPGDQARPGDMLSCSFCGKSQKQVKKLIAGPGVYICDACIDLCNEITQERHAEPAGAEQSPPGDRARSDDGVKVRTRVPNRRSRHGVVLISRQQAKTESWQKIAVKTPAGETLVGTFKLLPGLKNRKKIRIPQALLEKGLPGHHDWPEDGVEVRIRVPNWPLRNGLAALFVIIGLVGGAGPYAAVFAAAWGVAAFCARYCRLHGVDRFDPAMRRRFWPMFRATLAETALLYLVPVAGAIAIYLCAALVVSRLRGVLTVRELLSVQRTLSSASAFFDRWIKLGDRQLLLVLLGAYLLTCLLLAWRDRITSPAGPVPGAGSSEPRSPQPADGRRRRTRYGAAVALRWAVQVHGRYSGPAAAALATLASFTFLVNVALPFGTQLRLQAVNNTRDYKYVAQKIEDQLEEQLATRVVSLLYARIQAAMPSGYRQILSEEPFRHEVTAIQQKDKQAVLPLRESDPAAWRVVVAEEARIRQLHDLPGKSVINSPRVTDAVAAVPDDVTAGQVAAARDQASSAHGGNRVELINDSGKEVVLQLGNTLSAPFWDKVREQIRSQFPLAAPMVDALADSVNTQLQDTLGETITPLVNEVMSQASDVTRSITAAATKIAHSVNIPKLIRRYAADTSRITAQRRATRAKLAGIADQLQLRAGIIEGLATGLNFDASITKVLTLSPSLQSEVVSDLMAMIQSNADQTRMQQIYQRVYNVAGDPVILQENAAHAIQHLAPSLPGLITAADLSIADANCGCPTTA